MVKTEKNGHLQPGSTKIPVMINMNSTICEYVQINISIYPFVKKKIVFILSTVWQIDTTKNNHSSTEKLFLNQIKNKIVYTSYFKLF